MGDSKCEGSLFIELEDKWKNLFCWIRNGVFQAYEKQRVISVSNQSNTRQAVLEVYFLSFSFFSLTIICYCF